MAIRLKAFGKKNSCLKLLKGTRVKVPSNLKGDQMLKKFFISIFLCIILFGCVGMTEIQKKQVARFGKATQTVGDFAENEFVQIRKEIIEMNTALLIINKSQTNPKIDLDKPTSPQSATARVAAAKALKSYGELLNKLATEDRTEEIRKSAEDVIDNFESALDEKYSTEQKDAVSGLIVSLGNMWIEKLKKEAVNDIVIKYKDSVVELADLLVEDFIIHGSGYLAGYYAVATKLKNESIKVLTQGEHPLFDERERALEAFVKAEKVIQRSKEIDKKANVALTNLKTVNGKLSAVMAEDEHKIDDLKNYAKSIQDLVNMVKVLADN